MPVKRNHEYELHSDEGCIWLLKYIHGLYLGDEFFPFPFYQETRRKQNLENNINVKMQVPMWVAGHRKTQELWLILV